MKTVHMNDVMRSVTLNVSVKGLRIWRLRQTVGIWLIKCAARVMGIGLHVELDRDKEERSL